MRSGKSEVVRVACIFASHINNDNTPKYDCVQWRQMVKDELLAKGYTQGNARVIINRAWKRAGLTPMREWKLIRHDQVQTMTIEEAMGRNLILEAINNQPDEPVVIKDSARVVSAISEMEDIISGFKL